MTNTDYSIFRRQFKKGLDTIILTLKREAAYRAQILRDSWIECTCNRTATRSTISNLHTVWRSKSHFRRKKGRTRWKYIVKETSRWTKFLILTLTFRTQTKLKQEIDSPEKTSTKKSFWKRRRKLGLKRRRWNANNFVVFSYSTKVLKNFKLVKMR